jgi:nucleoside-diphosphate-sugar epimerase
LLEDAAYVFHLAGQPGVRPSWDDHFACYTAYNVLATQRLLQAVRDLPIHKLVYASSSSVYGTGHSPLGEAMQPNPRSPYGVTKLAGEQLCNLFWTEYGTPVIALRYFTVYGPRQRPDMAIHRFIRALLRDEPVTLYGDGRQARSLTYVDDVVDATLLAATVPDTGISINVGSEAGTSLQEVLAILGREAHCTLRVQYQASQAGDIAYTAAESMRARQVLGFVPRVSLQEGLRRQLIWQRAM